VNISDAIGQKVMVLFHTAKGLEPLGIDDESKYCRIVGYDHIGLWIENPHYEETPIRDEHGQLIPPDRRTRRTYLANILIPWGNVRSIVFFPERRVEGELESEEVRTIGSYL
jgi:hypothetical protein